MKTKPYHQALNMHIEKIYKQNHNTNFVYEVEGKNINHQKKIHNYRIDNTHTLEYL